MQTSIPLRFSVADDDASAEDCAAAAVAFKPNCLAIQTSSIMVSDEIASAERAAKAIQDKLNRLDEAFLFERSESISTPTTATPRNCARSSRSPGSTDTQGSSTAAKRFSPSGSTPLRGRLTAFAARNLWNRVY